MPYACTSRPDNNWAIPLLVIVISGIEGYGLGPFSGKVVRSSSVNTDWNWAFKTFALLRLSVTIWPLVLRQGIPIEYFFKDFM